jgi:hypothetical protein
VPLGQHKLFIPAHVWHVAPPRPQWLALLGVWQVPPWQQPLGQLVPLHTQVPPWQIWPVAHVEVQVWVVELHVRHRFVAHGAHGAPPVPQAVFEVPGWQVAVGPVPEQQPVQQVLPHSVEPALQVKPHVPAVQVAVPLVGAEQVTQAPPPVPHAPAVLPGWQVAVGPVPEQQPVQQVLPHGVEPALQVKPHVPAVQVAVPLAGVGQTWPQPPQLLTSVWVFVSQPFAALASQLAKPALQVNPHVPPLQVAVALAGVAQTLPQAPQLLTSLCTLVHTPAGCCEVGAQSVLPA